MSEITVASTTDTQEAVQQAAGLEPEAAQYDAAAEESHNQSETPPVSKETTDQHEASETGGTETAAESEPAEEGEARPQAPGERSQQTRKGRVQKRIDTLTRRLYEQQEELDALRERVSRPETNSNAQQRPHPDAKKPAIGDYPSYEEYIEAVADWRSGQRFQQQKQTELVQAEQERTREVFDTYNDAAQAARVKYEDFEEVVGRKDLKIPQAAQAAIIEAGTLGPDIAYYLGKHPEMCYELAEMSPVRAVAAIGQIEATLQGTAKAPGHRPQATGKPKTITSAPAPITPVSGSSRRTMTSMDELPYRDYKRLRDQEERAQRR